MRRSWSMEYNNGISKASLAASVVEGAFKLLFEKEDSDYYVSPNENTDMFNIYNAFTDTLRKQADKDIINPIEKCLLLKRILEIF